MSFAKEQKLRLLDEPMKNACCRRAFIQGLLAAHGERDDEGITIKLESFSAEYVHMLFSEQFGKSPVKLSRPKGGRGISLSARSASAEKYIGTLTDSITFSAKCAMCQGAFLRGVFLASGSVSDPKDSYCLSFSLKNRTNSFAEFFSSLGLTLHLTGEGDAMRLYTRSSSQIEDFFALAAMNQTTFYFMNVKIENEFRNHANRLYNCEMNNIAKAVMATSKQLRAIQRLADAELLSSLPEELEDTARLRLEHPDLSISQLAAISVPAISKPGLSHRLKRICKISEDLLGTPHDGDSDTQTKG